MKIFICMHDRTATGFQELKNWLHLQTTLSNFKQMSQTLLLRVCYLKTQRDYAIDFLFVFALQESWFWSYFWKGLLVNKADFEMQKP